MKIEYNIVGKITSSHGIHGEVKVNPMTDFIAERFSPGKIVFYLANNTYVPLTVQSKRGSDEKLIIGFSGFDSPESVYFLLHKTLYAEKNHKLIDNSSKHFYSDYIGLSVIQFGENKGQVLSISSLPHCDYLVVQNKNNQ